MNEFILNGDEFVSAIVANKFIWDMREHLKPGYKIFLTKTVVGTDYFGYKYKYDFVYLTDKYGSIKKYRNHNMYSNKWEEI